MVHCSLGRPNLATKSTIFNQSGDEGIETFLILYAIFESKASAQNGRGLMCAKFNDDSNILKETRSSP